MRRIALVIRGPAGIALLAGSLAVALRVPFLHDVPYPDEGGLLVVAAHWHSGGPFLYGDMFVDRPPLLLAFFRLAATMGGLVPLRVLGLALVLAAVAITARAGWLLAKTRGAVVASLSTAALLADPRLGTQEVDAETIGLPLVVLAVVLALQALHGTSPRARLWLLSGAGVAGSAALLVKQNLADGLAFAVVLVLASAFASRAGTRRTVTTLACLGAGAAGPAGAALIWSASSTGARGLWYSLYGFRLAASSLLFGTASSTRADRLHHLLHAASASGMVALLAVALGILMRPRHLDAATLALVTMLAVEVIGVAGGGYYWTHYLIGLVPGTALLLARAAGAVRRVRLVGLAVALTVSSTVYDAVADAVSPTPYGETEVGALTTWFGRVEHPGDSVVVLYGAASLYETTRLRPAYPYLWTLPQRVLDPCLHRLIRTLDRARGPTYVVVRMPLDPWGQDPHGRLRRALDRHYAIAAHVAGDTVYRRRSLSSGPAGGGRPTARPPRGAPRLPRTATGSTRRCR